jgi:hypothetical protein
MNHDSANVLRIRTDRITVQQIRRGAGAMRGRHAFFAEICDNFADVTGLLLTGPRTALSDFRHFVLDHRPQLDDLVVAYQAVEHPNEKQLVRLASRRFAERTQRNCLGATAPGEAAPLRCDVPGEMESAAAC